jgi:hypothetical protein
MLKGKSRIAMLAASGVIAALMVGSIVVASNMGFKARFTFTGGEKNLFAPPYTSPYSNAGDLLAAVAVNSGGIGTVTRRIPVSPPAEQFWNGFDGNGDPKNFLLKPGEGYDVIPSVDEDVVIVGAHDPFVTVPAGQDGLPENAAAGIPLGGSIGPGLEIQRDYWVAPPYHTTYVTAQDFRADLPGGLDGASTITRIDDQPGVPPAYLFWNGFDGNSTPKNFAITLGEAYVVRVLTPSPGFTPAHF